MKRPYISFLLSVVLPAAAAMVFAWSTAEGTWDTVQREAHTRVAHMVLARATAELQAEGGAAVDSLAGGGAPRAPVTVGRSTGYRTALYRGGRRWTGTEPAPGPERLPASVAATVGPGQGTPAGDEASAGVYLARATGATPPELVALVQPRSPEPPLVAPAVLLVMGLLLLFGALTGWIQLARRDLHERRLALGGAVAPALVPALATLVFFIHVDRSFQEAAHRVATQELGRGLAVAAAAESIGDPMRVRSLTGFHLTRVRGGEAEVSSLSGDLATVAALRAPPSSFTSSGTVTTTEGRSAYVALRLDGDAFVVATAPLPENRIAELRRGLFLAGVVLATWWILAAGGAWVASLRSTGSRPAVP